MPIRASLHLLRGMSHDVVDGNTIPNLGERRGLTWTENFRQARRIDMQVADVHNALLSLSRCADLGFESSFGRTMGALIDEETGEVVPLRRKGNLYVLSRWLKAALFGRQECRCPTGSPASSTFPQVRRADIITPLRVYLTKSKGWEGENKEKTHIVPVLDTSDDVRQLCFGRRPMAPTKAEIQEHYLLHLNYKSRRDHCCSGKAHQSQHGGNSRQG